MPPFLPSSPFPTDVSRHVMSFPVITFNSTNNTVNGRQLTYLCCDTNPPLPTHMPHLASGIYLVRQFKILIIIIMNKRFLSCSNKQTINRDLGAAATRAATPRQRVLAIGGLSSSRPSRRRVGRAQLLQVRHPRLPNHPLPGTEGPP